jgi:hypothetical protein
VAVRHNTPIKDLQETGVGKQIRSVIQQFPNTHKKLKDQLWNMVLKGEQSVEEQLTTMLWVVKTILDSVDDACQIIRNNEEVWAAEADAMLHMLSEEIADALDKAVFDCSAHQMPSIFARHACSHARAPTSKTCMKCQSKGHFYGTCQHVLAKFGFVYKNSRWDKEGERGIQGKGNMGGYRGGKGLHQENRPPQ